MADFTALKTAIQNAIKQNGNEEITGNILQEVLLSVVTTLGDSAINDLITALGNEVTARQQADGTLQQNITNEATARGNADTALSNRLGSSITAEHPAAEQIGEEAEAREAADTALQGLIDGITDNIENGYVYAGIATPSSTPATGKVFYLALTAGTYTNFGSTEVSQGINILKYNGSVWSLDAFIGIDDTPTPNSPKLVKSGGAFDSIMTDGSAFDISAHFASGGTLATYADLNAALTALDNLSASYKRGGMSIKFVLSSDNKFVQYRLMSDSWSTNTENWAICSDTILVDNPEFVAVWTDSDRRILLAIQANGDVYFGLGCPQQIIDYISQFDIEKVPDMVAFLSDLLDGDDLATLLNGKVDKVTGEKLIPSRYIQEVENPEWIYCVLSSDGKIICGVDASGKIVGCVGIDAPEIREIKDRISAIEENLSPLANGNYRLNKGVRYNLPLKSTNVELKFKTASSLYKQLTVNKLAEIENVLEIFVSPVEGTNSLYCDKSEANLILKTDSENTIPLKINNYGEDLFSIRLKYPDVIVALDGSTTMTTPMPSQFEGMYLSKSDSALSIHYADDSVYKSWNLANYTDVAALVDVMLADSALVEHFEILKYGGEGVALSAINNFSKIALCKEIDEILYVQGDTPTPTGETYWDSYPTIIRRSDVGFEHTLKLSYRVVDDSISFIISFDGMCIKEFNTIPTRGLNLFVPSDSIMTTPALSIMPYQQIIVPLISMQHSVDVSDELIGREMHTSTLRQYEMLSFLKEMGFVGVNYGECADILKGSKDVSTKVYCLNFDDYQASIWRTKAIRELFNQFRANPTLVYLFVATDLDNNTVPDYALTSEEYKDAKASGWDVISHGFTMYTPMLSYAQFVQGFSKLKEAWLRWYGEDICCYNPHGNDMKDYQFYLLKHLGFNTMTAVTDNLGYYCESCPSIDIQFSRVFWMDNEYTWQNVKNNITRWY